MAAKPIYKVLFYNRNQVYELFARAIYQSDMYGFLEVEEFVFDRSQVIVDPSEEKLKNEFAGVVRSYVPIHAIIRIDEVEKEGAGKIRELRSGEKVAQFPSGMNMPPPSDGD